MISKRALISFSIGAKYKDEGWCDVVTMDTCHLLLGKSWLYDLQVIHDKRANTYSFSFNDTKILLLPSKDIGKSKPSRDSINLLSLARFEEDDERSDLGPKFDLSDVEDEDKFDEYEQNKNCEFCPDFVIPSNARIYSRVCAEGCSITCGETCLW